MWEEEYSKVDSLQRNTLANVAFYACSCVEVFQPEIRRWPGAWLVLAFSFRVKLEFYRRQP